MNSQIFMGFIAGALFSISTAVGSESPSGSVEIPLCDVTGSEDSQQWSLMDLNGYRFENAVNETDRWIGINKNKLIDDKFIPLADPAVLNLKDRNIRPGKYHCWVRVLAWIGSEECSPVTSATVETGQARLEITFSGDKEEAVLSKGGVFKGAAESKWYAIPGEVIIQNEGEMALQVYVSGGSGGYLGVLITGIALAPIE